MNLRGVLRDFALMATAAYAVGDVIAIALGAIVAFWLRFATFDVWPMYREAALLAIAVSLFVFSRLRLYSAGEMRSWLAHMRVLAMGWAIVLLLLIVLAFMLKISAMFSRLWFGYWAIVAGVLLVGVRVVLIQIIKMVSASGLSQRRIVVVGTGVLARQIIEHVNQHPRSGWSICRVVAAKPEAGAPPLLVAGVPVLRQPERLARFVEKAAVDEVWFCVPLSEQHVILDKQQALAHSVVTQRWVPDLGSLRLIRHRVTNVLGIQALNITETPMRGVNQWLKALEDRVLSAAILIAISPLLAAIAIAIKCSSSGPVLYRQQRVGWNNKRFWMLKFRSMRVDAEAGCGPVWARADEDRATRFGRFLRRTSLDELPQFFNVLKGEMSIVGPRPERPAFVRHFKHEIPGYMQKHLVKAGITGLAQVNGWRGNTDLRKRIEWDLYYIEHWSLWLDLKIIALTVLRGFVHPNAY